MGASQWRSGETRPRGSGLVKVVGRTGILAACLAATACGARGVAGATDGGAASPRVGEAVQSHGHEHAHASGQEHAHTHEPGHEHAHGQAHGGGHAHGVDLPATAGPGYTVADVQFMQHMIGHHAQAVVMSAMARTHGASEQVRALAEKIDISQQDEIELMERWLAERGQVVPTEEQRNAMFMPGMLTPEQMAQLDAARGREFDRLFLEFMIYHHQGALDMVEALFAEPGSAQDPDLFRFVTDVDADQRDEIYVMQGMLDMLAATGGSEF